MTSKQYSFYESVYNNICARGSQRLSSYHPGSGLHAHHILPRHAGGTDDLYNITYLSVREHIVAHFLLWKTNRMINDLRSMKMLGAKLSVEQRRTIGEYCRDNKLGFFSEDYDKVRQDWRDRGLQTQKNSNDKNTFYWWSTEEGRRERASMGGKASISSGNNTQWEYWMSEEGRRERASMVGKSHKGKRCMYKPGDKTFKRVKAENIPQMLSDGYIFGSPHQVWNSKKVSS